MLKLKSQAWSHGMALAIVAIAVLLMLALDPWLEMTQTPFLLFFGAVPLSALYGGQRAGIFATLLSALLANYFFIFPTYTLSLDVVGAGRTLIFVLEGLLISVLVGTLRRTQQRMKESLQQLQASEAKFRRLVDSNIIGVVSADIHGAITDANDAFLNSMGYTREDVLAGRVRWDEMTPPDLKHLDVSAYEELITKGKNTPYEKAFIGKDNRRVPILVGAALLEDNPESVISFILDLTKLKHTEEELRASQSLFQSFMNYSPANAYIKDESGRFLYVNSRIERSFNRPLAKWIGKTEFDFFPYETAQLIRENDLAVLKGEQAIERLEKAPLEDGEHYYLSFKFPLQDAAGQRLLGGMSVDITELKRAEDALRESEERYRSIFEFTGVSIWEEDFTQVYALITELKAQNVTNIREYLLAHPDVVQQAIKLVRIRDVNQQTLRMFGANTKAELFNSLGSIFISGSTQVFVEEMMALAEGCRYYESETVLQTLDGKQRNILFTIAFPPPEAGYERVLVSLLDITDRKTTEAALRQSEERFRLATRAVAGMVYDWDVQTGEVYRSEGLYRLIGIRPEDVPPTQAWWSRRIHPDDFARIEVIWNSMLASSNARYDFEYRVRHEDGFWVDLWDRGYLIRDENEQLIRVVGSSTDITDRKRAEAEREQLLIRERAAREEAEAANRIKDEFLAVLSHELRSPLNPILGWTKLLRSREFDKAATTRALETIERNAKIQIQLIDDLLDVARILRGKLALNVHPVDLAVIVEAAIETVRLAAEAKSIQIQTHFMGDVGQVVGDSGRLQQVVWNLLSNAVKFTPSGGRVEVTLEQLDLQAQITVSDTGKGICPAFLPYVFDYFRQADSSTTRKFGGLGLGLAIVRHIVELHGGTVQAASPGEGQGATFTVRLPLLKDKGERIRNDDYSLYSSPDVSPLTGVRVLVVDDEADTRELIAVILQQAGADVTTVASAEEVLQTLAQSKIDVLVSDIGMPEMDGYMLLQQLRTLPSEQAKIPAIALTAYAGELNQQKALAVGFQRHLAKPVEPNDLVIAVAALVEQRRLL
jgi:PAS domain S-box-containing protein